MTRGLVSGFVRMNLGLAFQLIIAVVCILWTVFPSISGPRIVETPLAESIELIADRQAKSWADANLPGWFRKNFPNRYGWKWKEPSKTEEVIFANSLNTRETTLHERDEIDCWVVNKRAVYGDVSEVRYGTIIIEFKLKPNDEQRLIQISKELYKGLSQIIKIAQGHSGTHPAQFALEQVPMLGETYGQLLESVRLGQNLDRIDLIISAVERNMSEIEQLNKLSGGGSVVDTITRDYGNGVVRLIEKNKVIAAEVQRDKVSCEDNIFADMKPGDGILVANSTISELSTAAVNEFMWEFDEPEDSRSFDNAFDVDRKILNACDYVTGWQPARDQCYVMWKQWCSMIDSERHQERCNDALANAKGKKEIWDLCFHVRAGLQRSNCYNFGAFVKSICPLVINDKSGYAECIRITTPMPNSVRISNN